MQTPNIGAQRANAYFEMRRTGRTARIAAYFSPEHIARRAAEHRAKAEAHMAWTRLDWTDPRLAAFREDVDHLALAMREYALAWEEEN